MDLSDTVELDFEGDDAEATPMEIGNVGRSEVHASGEEKPSHQKRSAVRAPTPSEGDAPVVEKEVVKALKPAKIRELPEVSADEMAKLYEDLGVVGGSHVLRTVLARGVDGMTAFDVEKVFAEYRPYRVDILEDVSALIHFPNRQEASQMMLQMTKRLRRVRGAKKAEEEGEVLDSSEEEEEEGDLKEEHGDDVEVIEKGADHKPKKARNQFIQVDVDVVAVPDGKWRVVTQHVPDRRLMLVRFASRDELTAARNKLVDGGQVRKRKADLDDEGFSYKWSREEKVRPGLNIFTNDGKELEWDYEHDTRFFDETETSESKEEDAEIKNWGKDEAATEEKPKIKVRGRGATRAHLLMRGDDATDTMRADAERGQQRKVNRDDEEDETPFSRLRGGRDRDEEGEGDDERDPSPTPQPWDRRERGGGSGRLSDRISFRR